MELIGVGGDVYLDNKKEVIARFELYHDNTNAWPFWCLSAMIDHIHRDFRELQRKQGGLIVTTYNSVLRMTTTTLECHDQTRSRLHT
jgi:hypothetical protein